MYNFGANSKQLHLPNDHHLAPFHVSGIDEANSTIQDKGIIVSTCVRKAFETAKSVAAKRKTTSQSRIRRALYNMMKNRSFKMTNTTSVILNMINHFLRNLFFFYKNYVSNSVAKIVDCLDKNKFEGKMIWFGEKSNIVHLSNFKTYVRFYSTVLSYKHTSLYFTIY